MAGSFFEGGMKMECYMSSGCGSELAVRRNIEAALKLEGVSAETVFRRITEDEAMALGLRGSPSVLIDGKDVDLREIPGFS